MPSYSIRCRHKACRVRRVSAQHPDDMQAVQCTVCGHTKGWRIESRAYNQAGSKKHPVCRCDGVCAGQAHGMPFPHRTTHPLCDQNPQGPYNQAKARGVVDDDIPLEYLGRPMKETDDCPF